MKKLLCALLVALPVAATATEVTDNFESGTNPNQWGWQNNDGGHAIIEMAGGNPGAWLDSGANYFSDHPNLTTVPPPGSALRAALDSGTLHSFSIALDRMPSHCFPMITETAMGSLELFDFHSDPGGALIEAHTTKGPTSTGLIRFSQWQHLAFPIPSDSTDAVPPGWELNAPPELNYTWQDLMQNVDGIAFFVLPPSQITFDSCWRLGADNLTVTYGDTTPVRKATAPLTR